MAYSQTGLMALALALEPEDVLLLVGRDADALILHLYDHLIADPGDPHDHLAAVR